MSVVLISLIPTVIVLVIVLAVVVKVRAGLGSVPRPGGGGLFNVAGGGNEDKMALAQRLQTSGRKCRATVVNVRSTGLVINHLNIQCDVTFQLQPLDGGPAFSGEKRMTINQTQLPRVGDVWPAWVDPADPATFAVGQPQGASPEQIALFREFGIPHPLDPAGASAPAGPANWAPPTPGGAVVSPPVPPPPAGDSGSRVAELERLAKLRDQGVLTETEFQIEKNRILGQ